VSKIAWLTSAKGCALAQQLPGFDALPAAQSDNLSGRRRRLFRTIRPRVADSLEILAVIPASGKISRI
jgi:hypothetical protein